MPPVCMHADWGVLFSYSILPGNSGTEKSATKHRSKQAFFFFEFPADFPSNLLEISIFLKNTFSVKTEVFSHGYWLLFLFSQLL